MFERFKKKKDKESNRISSTSDSHDVFGEICTGTPKNDQIQEYVDRANLVNSIVNF